MFFIYKLWFILLGGEEELAQSTLSFFPPPPRPTRVCSRAALLSHWQRSLSGCELWRKSHRRAGRKLCQVNNQWSIFFDIKVILKNFFPYLSHFTSCFCRLWTCSVSVIQIKARPPTYVFTGNTEVVANSDTGAGASISRRGTRNCRRKTFCHTAAWKIPVWQVDRQAHGVSSCVTSVAWKLFTASLANIIELIF